MTTVINFELINVSSLRAAFCRGLIGYAVNPDQHIGVSIAWLYLVGGDVLEIYSTMTDTKDWDEVGTLVFHLLGSDEAAPLMTPLPEQWRSITVAEKLVVFGDNFLAESGLKIGNRDGETLTIVCSANVYRIELQAPFFSGLFQPEYETTRYVHLPL